MRPSPGSGAMSALVLELLERRVDRAGAGSPGAVAAALELLHQRVAAVRLLVEEDEHGGADVAAAHPPPAPAAEAARAAPVAGTPRPVAGAVAPHGEELVVVSAEAFDGPPW